MSQLRVSLCLITVTIFGMFASIFTRKRMNKPLVEIVAYSASVLHANAGRKTPVEFNHSAQRPTRDEQLSHVA